MPIILTEKAVERSTFVVTVSFFDEDETAVTPDSATWTLTTPDGTVVNSREDVAISPLATVSDIVLSGLDLALSDSVSEPMRKLLIEATYTSTLGAGLPLKDQITFEIQNLSALSGIV